MKKEKLIKIIKNFNGKKIGVIGDLMLDQFLWGDAERISPEAPIPVVLFEKESFMPGGAGNTANNIVALGGETFVVGVVGKDEAAARLIEALNKNKVNTLGVIFQSNRLTTQKIRVVARRQQMVRIDKEITKNIDSQIEKKIINFVASSIKEWSALVFSDYSKGMITKNLAKKIIELAQKYQIPIITAPKPQNAYYLKNVYLSILNFKEASEIARNNNLEKMGKFIQKRLNCNVLITQASQGMTLFEKKKIKHFPARAREVFDVAGAGDTVAATCSLALASGANLEEASQIANLAAGIVVGKTEIATVSSKELIKSLRDE